MGAYLGKFGFDADDPLVAGTTIALALSVTTTEASSASPLDLTSVQSLSAKLVRWPVASPVVTKVLSGGIAVNSAAGGTMTITFAPSDTRSLWGSFGMEVRIAVAGGEEWAGIGDIKLARAVG